MKKYAEIYGNELLNEVIPFWEKYSLDKEYGGYFTCLTEKGEIYDTDKFIWLQARQTWLFSLLYQLVQKKESWKKIALLGADFLKKYGRDTNGDWYFSLNQQGQPLVQPYNIFSDCFAAMAFGKLNEIDPKSEYAEIAKSTFENILRRQNNPKGKYNKVYPKSRNLQNFALPMILCNLSLELEPLLGSERVSEVTDSVIDLVMNTFYDKKSGLVLENVSAQGEFVDNFEGRLLNPGHAIEAMWFIMNLGIRKNDSELVEKAEKIMFQQLDHGWDEKYGGIFYFMDIKGHPPQQLEHDQKLWWVHLETLVALAKIYAYNQNPKAAEWFKIVHDYSWNHFRDKANGGEWYGYLNRQGEVSLNLKGGKWKGCFHVPRALLEVWKTLEKTER
ncbi:AGE family epimerase/isomerase [Maribacter algarum]|uniref:AGE family epimerase/isomerase n=1 Tax=Maribacter algarum (ex Zhang et al. 2020) TaxID=2578118 RepID=A0A5S3PZ21_9FLAO|nr:AGE family epimerase/isomerase [Maribacter algarum]TMM58567.1 AGE family epimerase/isomerase [Maribacter algarum]